VQKLKALLRKTLADLAAVDVSRVVVFLAEEIRARRLAEMAEEEASEEQLFADYIISVPVGQSAVSMAEELLRTDAEAAVRARLVNSTNITVQLAVQQVPTAVIAPMPQQPSEEDEEPENSKGLLVVVGMSTSGAFLALCLAGSFYWRCRRLAKGSGEELQRQASVADLADLPDLPSLLSRGLSMMTIMEEGGLETKGAESDRDEVIVSRL